MVLSGVKVVGRNFENRNFWAAFACEATTRNAMAKWRLPLDSACQIGMETVSMDFLIVYWRCTTEERSGLARF